MPKLFTVQQDIGQPEPCPFCASSEIELTRSRSIICRNCHVEVKPPAWHRTTEAEAVIFWNRSRRPGAAIDGIAEIDDARGHR
jgi:ribosomal protein L37AE/L43A